MGKASSNASMMSYLQVERSNPKKVPKAKVRPASAILEV